MHLPTRPALVALAALLVLSARAEAAEKPIDLSKPFSHPSHAKELRKEGDRLLGCPDCHTLTSTRGADAPICEKIRMPYPAHAACTGCHPTAFYKKPLVICAGCHTEVSFDQRAPMKEQSGTGMTPLGSELNHLLHLDPKQRLKALAGLNKDCSFCHVFADGGKRVLPPSHSQCCACHTRPGVTPNINDCAGCHARAAGDRPAVSLIRRKFSHEDHRTDPRTGQTLECLRCHAKLEKATRVREIVKPAMERCVPCHSGEVAFDYTQCLKCHGPEVEQGAVPESHRKKP